jgi:hypothetical protein
MGRSSGTKHKGSKLHGRGGLGGRGGRGGRRKSLRSGRGGVTAADLSKGMLHLSARDMAVALKDREEAGKGDQTATAYRRAMSTITAFANRHSKTMLPEQRAKLARAKDHLRDLFGIDHTAKGAGGPGAKRTKAKAQSRRNPRPPRASKSSRGGSHRASSK